MFLPSDTVEKKTQKLILLNSVVLAFAVVLSIDTTLCFADRIILRDLNILSGVTVTAFDEDGVKVTGHGLIAWDQIEKGTVSADKQADFDRLIKEIGTPLYRIRQRMKVGDYENLTTEAEKLVPRYRTRFNETGYLVVQALMWGRMAENRREEAVEAYLMCYEQLRRNKTLSDTLSGKRRLNYDPVSGLTTDLIPLFFDQKAAKKTLPKIAAVAQAMKQPLPQAAIVYYVSIALAAEDQAAAKKLLEKLETKPEVTGQWIELSQARQYLTDKKYLEAETLLSQNLANLQPFNLPAGYYLLGLARINSPDRISIEQGMLDLVRIPALHAQTHPELSAAALYHAMLASGRLQQKESESILRKELLANFSGTFYSKLLHQQLTPPDQ